MFLTYLNRSGLNLSNVDLASVSSHAKNSKYIFENFIEHIVLKSILKQWLPMKFYNQIFYFSWFGSCSIGRLCCLLQNA
jgi:hypothetical protein